MKILIAVTHLLGTGHLSRALTLGRAFAAAGHRAYVVSGGGSAPHLDHSGVDLIQLPPLRSDGVAFNRLLAPTGELADNTYLNNRVEQLCDTLREVEPDILITELFPFGRRSLKQEFLALLDRAKTLPNPPVILASIRDILAPPSKPKKAEDAATILTTHYDGVLVHSDPQATRLEASWPVTADISEKLRYTGYVAPAAPVPHPEGVGKGEILVSAGGGSVGSALYRVAVKAAKLRPALRWRILIGGNNAAEEITRLKEQHGETAAILEPARPDFRQMLQGAAASVSMCGYNTALDLLQTGVPAVIVPFDAGNEVEQSLRAASLTPLDGITSLTAADLTPEVLCAALDDVIAAPARPTDGFRFDGAARTVEIACNLAKERA
ncbi:glycosyltransferase family protein [Phaeobacter gallaeciensis]|uniref:glycosyltransferase family protein n=1 Tax=Phaeobacter gallaeciensis TaxID=60890 RepID=UPI000BBC6991|nr:glycosyltransferase [Phaeobacter gallaeciensis]ATF19534.1 putative glycosyltransferase protein [Phaeobacter gallaeciensis]ATF23643.1 putative glycosyltransferase protein [Phaeobacter gallaeciensis]